MYLFALSNLLTTSWISTDNGYPFLDKVDLMNSISSSRKHLDEIIRARWTRVLIKLILRCWGQNESHFVYKPEKVGFLYLSRSKKRWASSIYLEVRKAVEVLCTNTSKKASWWLDSFSTVNFKEGYIEFNRISPGSNTPQSTNYTATCLPSQKLSKLDRPDTQDTAGEAGTSS